MTHQPQRNRRNTTAQQRTSTAATPQQEQHPWPSHRGVLVPDAGEHARGSAPVDGDLLRRVLDGLHRL